MAVPLHPDDFSTELQCPICMSIPLEPRILRCCSRLFCKECIHEHLSRQKNCPMCRRDCKIHNVQLLQNEFAMLNRIWSNVLVKCEHHDEGCGWTGSISDYKSHEETCPKMQNIRRIKILEGEVTRFKQKNELLKMEHRSMTQDMERLQTKNDSLIHNEQKHLRENRYIQKEKKELQKQYDSLKFECDSIKAENESLKDSNAILKVDNESIKTNYDVIKIENDSLKIERDELKVECESIKTRYNSMKRDDEVIKTKCDVMKTKYGAMKIALKSLKGDRMKYKNASKKVKYKSIDVTNYKVMKRKLETMEREKKVMKRKLETMEREKKVMKQRLEAMEREKNLVGTQQIHVTKCKLLERRMETMERENNLREARYRQRIRQLTEKSDSRKL